MLTKYRPSSAYLDALNWAFGEADRESNFEGSTLLHDTPPATTSTSSHSNNVSSNTSPTSAPRSPLAFDASLAFSSPPQQEGLNITEEKSFLSDHTGLHSVSPSTSGFSTPELRETRPHSRRRSSLSIDSTDLQSSIYVPKQANGTDPQNLERKFSNTEISDNNISLANEHYSLGYSELANRTSFIRRASDIHERMSLHNTVTEPPLQQAQGISNSVSENMEALAQAQPVNVNHIERIQSVHTPLETLTKPLTSPSMPDNNNNTKETDRSEAAPSSATIHPKPSSPHDIKSDESARPKTSSSHDRKSDESVSSRCHHRSSLSVSSSLSCSSFSSSSSRSASSLSGTFAEKPTGSKLSQKNGNASIPHNTQSQNQRPGNNDLTIGGSSLNDSTFFTSIPHDLTNLVVKFVCSHEENGAQPFAPTAPLNTRLSPNDGIEYDRGE